MTSDRSGHHLTRVAFADESFHEADRGGFYVLAAAVFDPEALESTRAAMLSLRGHRRMAKLHWNQMGERDHTAAAAAVASQGGLHLVVVGSPVPRTRQERARARCLTTLVTELHSYSVTDLVIEARTKELDRRDVATVTGARYQLPKGTRFRVDHVAGSAEPLLWAADIVAGAVRAHREGNSAYRDELAEHLYEIDVDTGLAEPGHA